MGKQEESERLGFNEMIKKALYEYFERKFDRLLFEFLCSEERDEQKEETGDGKQG